MKNNKIIIVVVSIVFVIFISLWLINSGIIFKDEVSSRAKKVMKPLKRSGSQYGH